MRDQRLRDQRLRDRRLRDQRLTVLLALLLLVALALAGCVAIPTSGPVLPGASAAPDPQPGYRVQPLGPVADSSPVEIVRGFFLAGVGVDDEFSAARRFLAPARRSNWRPTQRTVVHPLGALTIAATEPEGADPSQAAVTVSSPVTGEVDDVGHYSAAGAGTTLALTLHLSRTDGQWRITDAPDLLLLDDPDFERVFIATPLYFADRTDSTMVPDERWVLDRASTATTVVDDLLRGPSAWLAPAVASGSSSASGLGSGSAVVHDGEAVVDLPRHFGDEPAQSLRLLQQQVVATVGALPAVDAVTITIEGGELAVTSPPRFAGESYDPTGGMSRKRVDAETPVVLSGGRLATLSGSVLTPVTGVVDLGGAQASAPAATGGQYAVLGANATRLLRLDPEKATEVLTGQGLTHPSFDRHGWLWSTSAAGSGTVTAVGRNGKPVSVEAGWLAGRSIVSLRLAPDGARALVASTGPDGARVDLVSVRRESDGTPTRIAAPTASSSAWLADVRAAVWVGQDGIAVLGTALPEAPQTQTVAAAGSAGAVSVWLISGGRPRAMGAPEAATGQTAPDPVSIAAGSSERTMLVGTADGRIWQLAGVDWVAVAVTATDPAYPG